MSQRPLSTVLAQRAARPPRSPTDGDPLRRVYVLFPAERGAAASAAVYASLHDIVLRARSAADDVRRRVLVHQLVQYRAAQAAARNNRRPTDALVDSLVVHAMDPTLAVEHPVVDVPQIPRPDPLDAAVRWSLPSNRSHSCFCDVVLVAMFMSSTAYDALLAGWHVVLWRDAYVRAGMARLGVQWPFALFPDVTDLPCFHEQLRQQQAAGETDAEAVRLARESALRIAEQVRRLLADSVVVNMRTVVHDETLRRQFVAAVTDGVEQLRRTLSEQCALFDVEEATGEAVFGPDDAAVFFHALLDVGGWGPAFLPVVRNVRAQRFSLVLPGTTRDLLADVPPRVTAEVSPTVRVPVLSFPQGAGGTTLQAVIDAAFLHDPVVEDSPSIRSHLDYILRERPDLASEFVPVLLPMRQPKTWTSDWQRLARVPDVFVFALARGAHSSAGPDVQRVFTAASVERGERVLVPVLDGGVDARLPYRVAAMVLEQGLHYTLYLRVGGVGDQWYFYDDQSSEMPRVDIHQEPLRTTIAQNAYLFWAVREQLRPEPI